MASLGSFQDAFYIDVQTARIPQFEMATANVILATELAREIGCSSQTIYNAIDRGALNEVRMGRHRLVLLDGKCSQFEVQETGGRATKKRFTGGRL